LTLRGELTYYVNCLFSDRGKGGAFMLREIIRKELLENILHLKFTLSFLVCGVLFSTCAIIELKDYLPLLPFLFSLLCLLVYSRDQHLPRERLYQEVEDLPLLLGRLHLGQDERGHHLVQQGEGTRCIGYPFASVRFQDEFIKILARIPDKQARVDPAKLPLFSYEGESLSESLAATIPHLVVLPVFSEVINLSFL